MTDPLCIVAVDFWPLRIPLARPYRLSSHYGTLTHGQAVLLRVTLANGVVGWGEADPHAEFDGYTLEGVIEALKSRAPQLLGVSVADWVEQGLGLQHEGSPSAAIDVACFDALARARGVPVHALVGARQHEGIDSLWPTSNGEASDDLAVIDEYAAKGFKTYMLKMGDRPIEAEIERSKAVMAAKPGEVKIMVDANQGWSREEAQRYAEGAGDLPIVLIEQPLAADDLEGLAALCRASKLPISVDESLQSRRSVDAILRAGAGDVFSIKISKNGGLANSRAIGQAVEAAGKHILMNSMIELGVTQAASLQLGVTFKALAPCGHAYMSCLRMADDVTDFADCLVNGRAYLRDAPGLGIQVHLEKIQQYQIGDYHVG